MKPIFLLLLLCVLSFRAVARDADSWRDQMLLLVYSPRYFGPNAFPVPELRSGLSPVHYEAEVRGEYHAYTGDKTRDLFFRLLMPLIRGKAGIEFGFIALEKYKLSPATQSERHAIETECPPNESYHGDVTLSAYYQLFSSERWCDAMFSLNLKTASGGRLCDARFTDATTYWVEITAGRNLLESPGKRYALRLQAMAGFYCWMTNDLIHRQNDALLYGAGITARLCSFSFSSSLAGFSGYKNNGDQPLLWRNDLRTEYRNNILSLRYTHGMQDALYETCSVAYIRRF
ncbi:MAG: hypothetical protein LBD89_06600 [Tannerellaceae bacterium]|jgi:hypothetical protein|nr:hypothetical protein [Tannerellaceae bacterium]